MKIKEYLNAKTNGLSTAAWIRRKLKEHRDICQGRIRISSYNQRLSSLSSLMMIIIFLRINKINK